MSESPTYSSRVSSARVSHQTFTNPFFDRSASLTHWYVTRSPALRTVYR